MKSILYLMHISWGWIKQRPQFLAEELSQNYYIDVHYRMSNHLTKGLNPEFSNNNLSIKGFRSFPLERLTAIPPHISYKLNSTLWRFRSIKSDKYDYIWVTDPIVWFEAENTLYNPHAKIIYDCMDDYAAFPYMAKYPRYKAYLESCEQKLLQKADIVLCSAASLKQKLISKYNIDRDYYVVNNAITSDITNYTIDESDIVLPENSLVYIGTISEWIDFPNLIKMLNNNKSIHIVLYGPKRLPDIPKHDRLLYNGTIPHSQILSVMNQASALIMPFIVNELIDSVNPVKLYEYIYAGKPIVASKYFETEKFADYVSLYSSYADLQHFVDRYILGKQTLDQDAMRQFALNNTWTSRKNQIISILNGQ